MERGPPKKSLTAAALHWWRGGHGEHWIPPSCVEAVRAWCASCTQWRAAPAGGLIGLDYAGARAACKGLGVNWAEALPGLRVMEGAVLDAQREERP